ncbi:MAG TPA: DoxX family protein [Verrucomicrobiota bacterium]|nr:DoxX family protein [Verrucomicrobiota bacterium]
MAPRLIAALPLLVFGSFHLTGRSPLLEILRRAEIPFPEANLYLAPIFMVMSGLSMGIGFYARIGAVIGSFAMLVATYSKLVIEEWPGPMEIPLLLPLTVLAGCLVVLAKGPGAWSLDLKASL